MIKIKLSWCVNFVSRFVLYYLTLKIIVTRLFRIDHRVHDFFSFGDCMKQKYYIFNSRSSQNIAVFFNSAFNEYFRYKLMSIVSILNIVKNFIDLSTIYFNRIVDSLFLVYRDLLLLLLFVYFEDLYWYKFLEQMLSLRF